MASLHATRQDGTPMDWKYTNAHISENDANYTHANFVHDVLDMALEDVLYLLGHWGTNSEDDVVGFTTRVVREHEFTLDAVKIDEFGCSYKTEIALMLADCCDVENAEDTISTRVLHILELEEY